MDFQTDIFQPIARFIPENINTADFVWFIFFAVLAFWIIYSIIMLYHWLHYSLHSKMIVAAMLLYFAISFALVSALFYSAFFIS
jgi:hypothetical protein